MAQDRSKAQRALLFGGALMAAGIAHAQDLQYSGGLAGGIFPAANSNVYNYSTGQGDSEFLIEIDPSVNPLDVYAREGTLFTEVYAGSKSAHVSSQLSSSEEGYAASRLDAYLMFDEDSTFTLSWDFVNSTNSVFEIEEATEPFVYNTVFFQNAGSGSTTFTFLAGTTYLIDIFTYTESFTRTADTFSTASITAVPAPGAAALAAFAGIAAVRRKR